MDKIISVIGKDVGSNAKDKQYDWFVRKGYAETHLLLNIQIENKVKHIPRIEGKQIF